MSDVVVFQEIDCINGKKIGLATLNAERSLNALSGEMVDILYPQLVEWQKNQQISAVFLQGSGEKAFCAGGDIVHLYKEMQSHTKEYAPEIESYFTKEYKLDYLIHTFNKPFIVWGNGIVMGGGLGMMVGASHRVVTESSRIAMPEISIGLFPDVGGTWFLNRMPNHCGLFLGLTGASINAADAKYTKLANFFILDNKKQILIDALTHINWGDTTALNHDKLSNVMHDLELQSNSQLPVSNLRAQKELIEQTTSHDNITDIVKAIINADIDDKWFNKAQKSLVKGSPLSVHLVYRQLQSGRGLSLADCFKMELNLAVKAGKFGEFSEGVRALLIDKDFTPQWHFTSVNEVDVNIVDWFFELKWQGMQHPLASLDS